MTLIGLDLNATRARAVIGPAGVAPSALPLDGAERDLPVLLNLEGRQHEVGRSAWNRRRRVPHLVCANFLPHLGSTQQWHVGRHRLDAARALSLVFERLRSSCAAASGVVIAAPDYLSREQGELCGTLAAKARLPLLGSVSAPIAAALSAYNKTPWSRLAIVVDVDDHALTCTVLATDLRGEAESLTHEPRPHHAPTLSRAHAQTLPRLGLHAWKLRLIDAIADRCIRHSRRDPRDSAAAEQMLYEQLDDLLDACWLEQMMNMVIQGAHWSQNVLLRPEEVRGFCTPLVQPAIASLREILTSAESQGVGRVLVTATAGRLPGFCEALQEELAEGIPVVVLPADAAAVGAHDLAIQFQRGDQPREHLDTVVRYGLPSTGAPKNVERKRRLFRFY